MKKKQDNGQQVQCNLHELFILNGITIAPGLPVWLARR